MCRRFNKLQYTLQRDLNKEKNKFYLSLGQLKLISTLINVENKTLKITENVIKLP